jgi:hypothetical protein
MKQLSEADLALTDIISCALSIWFALFALFTYNAIAQGQKGLPIELSLVLSFIFVTMTTIWYVLLELHRRCLKTYPLICSLMALDQSYHKQQFIEILDYFVKRRTCYTIYRSYPLTTTSHLTIISYSLSCFFMLCSANNRNQ